MIAATATRVHENTGFSANERIRAMTRENLSRLANLDTGAIDRRLDELDYEWDVERVIEAEAPIPIGTGLLLGVLVSRKWLILPALAGTMVLLHAIQGWYPLLPLFRALGVRTRQEISTERHALKVLRGDFQRSGREASARPAMSAIERPPLEHNA